MKKIIIVDEYNGKNNNRHKLVKNGFIAFDMSASNFAKSNSILFIFCFLEFINLKNSLQYTFLIHHTPFSTILLGFGEPSLDLYQLGS